MLCRDDQLVKQYALEYYRPAKNENNFKLIFQMIFWKLKEENNNFFMVISKKTQSPALGLRVYETV